LARANPAKAGGAWWVLLGAAVRPATSVPATTAAVMGSLCRQGSPLSLR
jgi:hypothetical protein